MPPLPNALLDELTAFRRALHRRPETGAETPATAAALADRLEAAGLRVTRGVGGHGVVATLGREGGRAVGLRADMDALPIREATGLPHASEIAGAFHGCGHDGHSTMLLGAALLLAQEGLGEGAAHFIFQPDEENGTGAAAMIADGLFERFPMDAVYGLHNMPGLPVGSFAIQPGPAMAFEDDFEIRLAGRGGHASMPDRGTDALVAGAALVMQLQTVISRAVEPKAHAVLSVTEFLTDGARNVIPSHATLRGDCRGFSDAVSARIRARMAEIAEGVAAAHGVEAEMDYATSFKPLVNDPEHAARCIAAAAGLPGAETDAEYGAIGGAEDFARMLDRRPGALILMGNGTEGPHALPLHNPGYDFNDEALPWGVAWWAALARRALAA